MRQQAALAAIVVECGSGGSTMWIGRALRRVGEERLISLETSADWVVIVTGLLQHEGLSIVDIRHAPLEPIQVAGRRCGRNIKRPVFRASDRAPTVTS